MRWKAPSTITPQPLFVGEKKTVPPVRSGKLSWHGKKLTHWAPDPECVCARVFESEQVQLGGKWSPRIKNQGGGGGEGWEWDKK